MFANNNEPVDMMEIARRTTRQDVERRRPGTVKVMAPAKVNLVLAVGGRREDGYHLVQNVMQTVMLHDVLYVWPTDAPGEVACECISFEDLPAVEAAAEDNLAVRAVRALAQRVFGAKDSGPGLGIRIEKHVPARAGLGGGSSDAAAALVGAAKVWADSGAAPPVAADVLEDVARGIGADVAFFLGGGAARFDGAGEHFAASLESRSDAVVIVQPPVGLGTPEVYRKFDELVEAGAAEYAAMDAPVYQVTEGLAAALSLENSLQAAAVALAPEVAEVLAWAAAWPEVSAAQMTGSGSAVFAVCPDFASACKLAADAKRRGWWARTTAFAPVRAAVVPA